MLNAFKDKLFLWCRRVKGGNYSNFPSLEIVDDSESSTLIPSVCEEIVAHLEVLSTFDRYFDGGKINISKERLWIHIHLIWMKFSDDGELKEDLIELRSNCALDAKIVLLMLMHQVTTRRFCRTALKLCSWNAIWE